MNRAITNNLPKLLYAVLKVYGVKVTYQTIDQTLNTHPEYPSMQSVSDALDSLKVKHVAFRPSLEKLQALDVPVITFVKRGKSFRMKDEYILITRITDAKVHYRNAGGREFIENRDRFEAEKWSGMALAIEDTTDAGEPDYNDKRNTELKEKLLRYAFVGGFAVLLTVLTFLSRIHDTALPLLPGMLLFLVNAGGCYISYILIRHEKKLSGSLTRKFCVAGSHIDCNTVTKSSWSKLFGLISFAEIGMAYFTAVMLWLALAPVSADRLVPLWWFFIATLPFTVWSLFTQAFLIRKWCLFCCVTVLLLWINAGILYLFLPDAGFRLPLAESALFALLIMACTAAVMYIGKTVDALDSYAERREMARIKYDIRTLQSQLSASVYETANVGFAWGNPQARHEITLYPSIACSPCGSALKELRRLTEIYPDFGYRLIFAVKSDDYEQKSNAIVRHLINLHRTMNRCDFFDMLDARYSKMHKKLEVLQATFPVSELLDCRAEIDACYHFGQQAKISHTPAILINGRLLSQLYSYKDLFGIARTLYAEE